MATIDIMQDDINENVWLDFYSNICRHCRFRQYDKEINVSDCFALLDPLSLKCPYSADVGTAIDTICAETSRLMTEFSEQEY